MSSHDQFICLWPTYLSPSTTPSFVLRTKWCADVYFQPKTCARRQHQAAAIVQMDCQTYASSPQRANNSHHFSFARSRVGFVTFAGQCKPSFRNKNGQHFPFATGRSAKMHFLKKNKKTKLNKHFSIPTICTFAPSWFCNVKHRQFSRSWHSFLLCEMELFVCSLQFLSISRMPPKHKKRTIQEIINVGHIEHFLKRINDTNNEHCEGTNTKLIT